jgi:hypothetical protein
MGAIKGDIGAAAAKRWNGDEKIAIKQQDGLERSSSPSKPVLSFMEARTKRRC